MSYPSLSHTTMDEQTVSSYTVAADLSNFNIASALKTPHNARLYKEVQNLKKLINELVDYQTAHPLNEQVSTESEKQIQTEIGKKEKYIRAQLSVIKTLYRQSVLRVREEKADTADVKAVNDALILGLHNLKYEEQSLHSEISAAENYEYVKSRSREYSRANKAQPQVHEAPAHKRRTVSRRIPRAKRAL
jgi:THO complex subunit 5